jgi:long-chain acyl-CoA synthetase
LESLYRTCNLVQNILVYADQQKSKPVAIVLPAEPALKAFAAEKGFGTKDSDLEDLVHDRKLEAAVHTELLAAGKRGGLKSIELIAGVVLVPEEWTPQNVGSLMVAVLTLGLGDCGSEVK